MTVKDRVMTMAEAAAAFSSVEVAGDAPALAAADGAVMLRPSSAARVAPEPRPGLPDLPEGWEDVVRTLFREAGRYVRGEGPRNMLGGVARVRATSPLPDYGPGVVVEQTWSAAPDFKSSTYGDARYGKRPEVRVLFLCRGCLIPLWLETSDLEPWPVPCDYLA